MKLDESQILGKNLLNSGAKFNQLSLEYFTDLASDVIHLLFDRFAFCDTIRPMTGVM